MYSFQARFASDKYLIIKNLFIDAPPDFYVTREDLLSILEHLDHIERYRFEGNSKRAYWQTVYAKFKNSEYAEQARKVLHSMRYISVELLPDVLRRYDQLEENIRFVNPICDHPSCIVIESIQPNVSFKDLLNKFSPYGYILSTSEHTDFVALWYEKTSEAIAAEIDNNKWKNKTQYFSVKLYEQTKELTLRMINLKIIDCSCMSSYETFEDEAYVGFPVAEENSLPEVKLHPFSLPAELHANFSPTELNANFPLNKFHSENIQNSNVLTDFFDGASLQSNNMQRNSNDIYHITSPLLYTCTEAIFDKPELVSFKPNDFTSHLPIMNKEEEELNSENTNLIPNSSFSVETPKNDLSICSNVLASSAGTLSSSCPNVEIYGESESDACSESFSSSSMHTNFLNSKTDLSSSSKVPETLDTSNISDLEEGNPDCKIPSNTQLQGNQEIGSLPFYQRPIPATDSCIENSCMQGYGSSIYNIPNSYTCPCCGSWIFTASPWSVVPNMFIVPITSFGKPRRSSSMHINSAKAADEISSVENLPATNKTALEFDEENFPPLEDRNQVFSSNIKTCKDPATMNRRKSRVFKAMNEENVPADIVNDFQAIKTEKLFKDYGRKKHDSRSRFFSKKQIVTNQNKVCSFNSPISSQQILSSTSSDERNDNRSYRRRHSRRKKHSQNPMNTTVAVYSYSSNCTLNFKPATRRRRPPMRIEGNENA